MKKIYLGTAEFELHDDIYAAVLNDLRASEYTDCIDLGEDAIVIADFLSARYSNEILKYVIMFIKDCGDNYIRETNPELINELDNLYKGDFMIHSYAYTYYAKAKMDIEAHMALINMLNDLCNAQKALIGMTRG